MSQLQTLYQQLSNTHHVSVEAIQVLVRALVEGGYRSANFNHPELGGVGKWNGGDVILGDMSQEALRLKIWRIVQGLLPTLQQTIPPEPIQEADATFVMPWWNDVTLREPVLKGMFESTTFGYFLEGARVVVKQSEHITHYDASGHLVTDLQMMSGARGQMVLVLQTLSGDIAVSDLPQLDHI